MPNAKEVLEWYERKEEMDIRERLKEANKVEEMRKKADKERIAELEQENEELMDAVIELADIIAGGGE